MKHLAKWVLAFAGAALVVGLVAFGTGWVLGGREEGSGIVRQALGEFWDDHGIHIGGNDDEWDDRDDDAPAGSGEDDGAGENGSVEDMDLAAFTELDVSIELGDVIVKRGDSYGVSLKWNVPTVWRGYRLEYENKDGELKIWSVDGAGKVQTTGRWTAEAVITLPEGAELGEVELHTDLGDIDCQADGTAQDVDLSTNLGDVYWSGSAGARDVTLHSDMGDVTLDCAGPVRNAEITTKMGQVNAKAGSVQSLTAKTDLGDARVELKEQTDLDYDLSTSLGEVWVNGEKRKSPVKGTLGKGGSQITASSDLGDVSLTTK